MLPDDTVPLPPLLPPPARHRTPTLSGATVAGLMALLALAVGGLVLGMAVAGWRAGTVAGPAVAPSDPPSPSPAVTVPSVVAPSTALVAGPPAPSVRAAVAPAAAAGPKTAVSRRAGKHKTRHRHR